MNYAEAYLKYKELSRDDSEYFETDKIISSETEKAYWFTNNVCIPKSQMIVIDHKDLGKKIFVKLWLYDKLNKI